MAKETKVLSQKSVQIVESSIQRFRLADGTALCIARVEVDEKVGKKGAMHEEAMKFARSRGGEVFSAYIKWLSDEENQRLGNTLYDNGKHGWAWLKDESSYSTKERPRFRYVVDSFVKGRRAGVDVDWGPGGAADWVVWKEPGGAAMHMGEKSQESVRIAESSIQKFRLADGTALCIARVAEGRATHENSMAFDRSRGQGVSSADIKALSDEDNRRIGQYLYENGKDGCWAWLEDESSHSTKEQPRFHYFGSFGWGGKAVVGGYDRRPDDAAGWVVWKEPSGAL